MEEQAVLAKMIIEMLGSPKEHLEKTIRAYIEKLKKETEVVNIHFEKLEQKGTMYSTFVELEIRFKNLAEMMNFCFDSMPSSVEVIEPSELKLPTLEVTNFLNDLQDRLHKVDMLLKYYKAENKKLDSNALKLMKNFIKHYLQAGEKTAEEIAVVIGLNKESVTPFLDRMIEEGRIKEKEGKYSIK